MVYTGAKESEVACMGTLTANLHLLMNTFYRPTKERYKIFCEAGAFPSDQVRPPRLSTYPLQQYVGDTHTTPQYAMHSQALTHGLDPADAMLELAPRAGEFTLRPSDILDTLAREGPRIALVLFSGVQYYTGQVFPMGAVTRAAREQVRPHFPAFRSSFPPLQLSLPLGGRTPPAL